MPEPKLLRRAEMSDNIKDVSEQEYVTCTKCGLESPLGTPQCPSCKSFLKGGSSLQSKGGSASKDNLDSTKKLLQEYSMDYDTCGETLRVMAKRAVNGTTADMRAFLQQIEELKAAPRAGTQDLGPDVPVLVLTGETVDAIDASMAQLRKIVKEIEDEGK